MPEERRFDLKIARRAALYTLIVFVLAHGYRLTSLSFTNDSTYLYQPFGFAGQTAIGRWTLSLYRLLRGPIAAPYLIGVFSCAFLCASVALIADQLRLSSPAALFLACGTLAVNATMTSSFATFVNFTDSYMAALLLNVLGARLALRRRFGFLPGALLLAFALGIYQAYLQAAAAFMLIALLGLLLDGEDARAVFLRGVRCLACLLLGLAVYRAGLSAALRFTGASLAGDYNGVSNVGNYAGVSIPALLAETYLYPFRAFLDPKTYAARFAALANLALFALLAALFARVLRLRSLSRAAKALAAFLLLLLPLGMNAVYFISQGLMNESMTFSYFLFYPLVFMLLTKLPPPEGKSPLARARRAARAGAYLLTGALLFGDAVYANQTYLKRDLEYDTTLSFFTRLIDRVEQTEGYVPGETPVAMVGNLSGSQLFIWRPGFDHLYGLRGCDNHLSTTYYDTYGVYLHEIFNDPIRLLPLEDAAAFRMRPEVTAMPAYPAEGSVRMLDGTLVVRLADYK